MCYPSADHMSKADRLTYFVASLTSQRTLNRCTVSMDYFSAVAATKHDADCSETSHHLEVPPQHKKDVQVLLPLDCLHPSFAVWLKTKPR